MIAVIMFATSSFADALHRARVHTPLTRGQLMVILRRTHDAVFGKAASKKRLAGAWAHVALENGKGRLTFNHNLGNIARTAGSQQYYFTADRKYRDFDTFDEAAVIYWKTIEGCWPALHGFDMGDADTAAKGLKRCRYYEADPEVYMTGLKRLLNEANAQVFKEEDDERLDQAITDAVTRGSAAARTAADNDRGDRSISGGVCVPE